MPGVPKPTRLKVLQGTFRKDRAKNEPNPTAPIGDPPAHLTQEQAFCWREIVGICADRVLTEADRLAVEIAACLMLEYRMHAKTGMQYSMQKLSTLIVLLGKMGLTPSDRAKINLPGKPTKNAFSNL